MDKIELLKSYAKAWFGNSQGIENYMIEMLGD